MWGFSYYGIKEIASIGELWSCRAFDMGCWCFCILCPFLVREVGCSRHCVQELLVMIWTQHIQLHSTNTMVVNGDIVGSTSKYVEYTLLSSFVLAKRKALYCTESGCQFVIISLTRLISSYLVQMQSPNNSTCPNAFPKSSPTEPPTGEYRLRCLKRCVCTKKSPKPVPPRQKAFQSIEGHGSGNARC